jgi:hypothetical protein
MIRWPRSLAGEDETLVAVPPEGDGNETTAAAIALSSGCNKRASV